MRRAGPRRRAGAVVGAVLLIAVSAPTAVPAGPAADGIDVPEPRVQTEDLLIANHSFEDGLANWSASNGRGEPPGEHCDDAARITTDWASAGEQSLQFPGQAPCVVAGAVSEPVEVVAGERFSAYADTAGSGKAALGLRFLDESGDVIDSVHGERVAAGDVVQISGTAPADAAAVAVELAAQKTVQFDNVLVTAPFTATGNQITNRGTFLAMAAGYDQNDRAVTFTVATGSAADSAVLMVTDIVEQRVTQTVKLPGVTGSWSIEQNPVTGVVYIAGYGAPGLYEWQPGDEAAQRVGTPPIDHLGMMYGLTTTPEGVLYGGAWGEPTVGYAGAQLWRYDDDGFELFGPVLTDDANYTRAVAYEAQNEALWAGTGTVPHLYGCDTDGSCQDFTHLLNDDILAKPWVYGMTAGSGYVQVWAGDSNSTGGDYLVVLRTWRDDAGTLQAEVVHEVPGVIYNGATPVVDDKVYYTVAGEEGLPLHSLDVVTGEESVIADAKGEIFSRAWKIIDLRDPEWPGPSVVGFNSQANLVAYNIETGRFARTELDGVPDVALGVNDLVDGPDGRIWSAAYMSGGTGAYEPMRSDEQQSWNVGRQAESMIAYQGRIYQGTYPNGDITTYVPADIVDGQEPATVCRIGAGQNRPYGLLGVGDRIYYGSQAEYGHDMGAIGYVDLDTGECTTFTEQVGHYSVNTLTAADGLVLGGTSIFFSWDGEPIEDEGQLLIFTEADETIEARDLPVRGLRSLDALVTDSDGTVWAYAAGWLFGYDPAADEWISQEEIFPDWKPGDRIPGNYATMIEHEGRIYGNAAGRLFSFDPGAARAGAADVEVHIQGLGPRLIADDYGHLYTLYSSTQLMRINPDAL